MERGLLGAQLRLRNPTRALSRLARGIPGGGVVVHWGRTGAPERLFAGRGCHLCRVFAGRVRLDLRDRQPDLVIEGQAADTDHEGAERRQADQLAAFTVAERPTR